MSPPVIILLEVHCLACGWSGAQPALKDSPIDGDAVECCLECGSEQIEKVELAPAEAYGHSLVVSMTAEFAAELARRNVDDRDRAAMLSGFKSGVEWTLKVLTKVKG